MTVSFANNPQIFSATNLSSTYTHRTYTACHLWSICSEIFQGENFHGGISGNGVECQWVIWAGCPCRLTSLNV